jgi:predicted lipoprotein with Yx(FWY)xxD motif
MRAIKTYTALAAVTSAAALGLTACGGGGSASSSGSASGAAMTARTVAVKHIQGLGNVLVDSKGAALYSPAQETSGRVLCTGSCTSIWIPLRLPAGKGQPVASSALMGSLGVVTRPGGGEQVTFDGRPLYRFAEDTKAGSVTGNNVTDSFGGRQFTWHVASTGSTSGGGTGNTSGGGSSSTGRGYGY